MRAAWRIYVWSAATAVLVTAGALLVRHSEAIPATTWMHQHTLDEFRTAGDLVRYLHELRMPIPPLISAAEILSVQATGSSAAVTKYLYRAALIGAFVVAVWLTYPSVLRLIVSLGAGLVFLDATVAIHPLNAQIYDICFPLFLLLFVAAWRGTRTLARRPRASVVLALIAGFFLSMAELVRPFGLLLLPLGLAGAYWSFATDRRRVFGAMLIPVVLFSGVWHLHLWLVHGQVLSTNYAGFNLRRAWPQVPLGATVTETQSQPPDDRSWPNLNTAETYAASQLVERATLAYVAAHPVDSLRHAIGRIAEFVAVPTTMYGSTPVDRPGLAAYPLVARAGFVWVLVNVMAVGWHGLRAGSRRYLILAEPDNLLVIATAVSVLTLSLGEANEEARLVLTVLPLIAALPVARRGGAVGPVRSPTQCADGDSRA